MKQLVFAVLMMPGICLLAQPKQSMEKLSPFIGKWEGGGWYMDQTGTRYEFTQCCR
ncbi:MAG: hypothetical protein RLN88_02480 [Ekhidna sp.]